MLLTDLDQYKASPGFPADYPPNVRRFYTQIDDVHSVLTHLLSAVTKKLTVMQFGYDDDALNAQIIGLLKDPTKIVEISLDQSQAGGAHERAILAADIEWIGNSIAIGTSAFGHQISHDKGICVDGIFTVGGSTNWSASGEGSDPTKKQNNELSVYSDRAVAFEFEAQAHAAHTFMLQQMAKKTAA